jgi:hypothetical protein
MKKSTKNREGVFLLVVIFALFVAAPRGEGASGFLARAQRSWYFGLGLQKLQIEHGNPTARLPTSVLWGINVWGQHAMDFPLARAWSLRTTARLGTSRYYRKLIWFLYGAVAAGPQYALASGTRVGVLFGYRYDQELLHGGVGTAYIEHEISEKWGLSAGYSYTRFNVPKDSGVKVSTNEYELGFVKKI